ncbi:hypothetical protein [Corynebacterium aquatimens]|uniref:Integral membrane protein n=1 Tax=Corynebacterium aquatimens TaxID=1190508 RepID=A0A931E3B8_9CORY|nr:hypothetical protein [Corynebacterium aquatimens]MBG6123172.1 hypothetical protein [Corynebacterium aquatimens]
MSEYESLPAPIAMKVAAVAAIIQSVAVIGYGVYSAVETARGGGESSIESTTGAADFVGYGTAVFIIAVFGFVIYAAVNILRGRQWGRTLIIYINIILLGVAFFMFQGGAAQLGAVTVASVIVVLVAALHPKSRHWAESNFVAKREAQAQSSRSTRR